MRYLRKFNELKSDTYKNAAAGLAKLGHSKRAADLNDWSLVSKQKEIERKYKSLVDLYSKHGVFKAKINETVGNFYVWFNFSKYDNTENLKYWLDEGRFNGGSLWLVLDICLLPADDETLQLVIDAGHDFHFGEIYYPGTLSLKLSDAIYDESDYDSGEWEFEIRNNSRTFYIEHNEVDFYLENRFEANKFRKLILDIFNGNIEMGETSENPGGLKEKIIDFYCNENHVSIEEFDNFVDSLKSIKVNSFYKD